MHTCSFICLKHIISIFVLFDKYFCLWHCMLSKALMFSLLIWQAGNTKKYLRKWPVPWNTSFLEIYGNRKYSFLLYLVTIVKYLISAYFYVHEKVFVVLSIPFLRKSMLYFFFFSSSDRIVYSVFLYTLALLKGRHSDQVIFFFL